MKNRTSATLGLLALLATTSAFGQPRQTADIPFEFRVGNTVMPAGQCEARQAAHGVPNVLLLKCWAGKGVVAVSNGATPLSTVPGDGREGRNRESIQLYEEQLVKQFWTANPRTVVVLVSSFPFATNWS
jgi:hypothetical protein